MVRYLSIMDIQQLRVFRTVTKTRSFSRAARTLGTGQSTVSDAIRRLEEDLGTPLFLRGRDGVQLTEAGAILEARASAVLDLIEHTTQEISDLRLQPSGRLVLGCHDSLGSYFLPAFLSSFLPSHPAIELAIENHSSSAIREQVIAGEIHYGLLVNPTPHPDLVMMPAFQDIVQIFALESASNEEEATQRLRESRLIVPARAPFDQLLEAITAGGITPEQVLTTGDLGLARSLAIAGLGLALLPSRVATNGSPLVPLHRSLPRIEDQVYLVWRSNQPKTRAHITLREALLTYARSLAHPDDCLMVSHDGLSNIAALPSIGLSARANAMTHTLKRAGNAR